jgi:hypothetical protein
MVLEQVGPHCCSIDSPSTECEVKPEVVLICMYRRYPGARFDSESYTYAFYFSKEILDEWKWTVSLIAGLMDHANRGRRSITRLNPKPNDTFDFYATNFNSGTTSNSIPTSRKLTGSTTINSGKSPTPKARHTLPAT